MRVVDDGEGKAARAAFPPMLPFQIVLIHRRAFGQDGELDIEPFQEVADQEQRISGEADHERAKDEQTCGKIDQSLKER